MHWTWTPGGTKATHKRWSWQYVSSNCTKPSGNHTINATWREVCPICIESHNYWALPVLHLWPNGPNVFLWPTYRMYPQLEWLLLRSPLHATRVSLIFQTQKFGGQVQSMYVPWRNTSHSRITTNGPRYSQVRMCMALHVLVAFDRSHRWFLRSLTGIIISKGCAHSMYSPEILHWNQRLEIIWNDRIFIGDDTYHTSYWAAFQHIIWKGMKPCWHSTSRSSCIRHSTNRTFIRHVQDYPKLYMVWKSQADFVSSSTYQYELQRLSPVSLYMIFC